MNKRITTILLVGIIFIASFLRLWQLGVVPISPDWDEVALGYDAYSIIHTGRDEFGNFMPVVLRSFDDYKPALYTYLTVPAVELFGLNVFATRLPSAIFGILTVLSTYFLVKELFRRDDLALLSAFLLSISPWHIQFSRIAFESNIGLALNVLIVLFFLKGLKKPWLLMIAAASSALAIYAYQSEKVFTPLLVVVLCTIYLKAVLAVSKKYLIYAVVVGLIVISPMFVYVATHKEALLRAQATLAFSDKTVFLKNNITRLDSDRKSKDVIGLLLDNRRVLYAKTGISGYLSHFNLNWLFITGDINRHHAPEMGLLYLWEFPFILIGLYAVIFGNFFKGVDKKSRLFLLVWFFIAPVPAAFTSGVPHAVRTLNFLPTFQIFTAIGLVGSFVVIKNYKLFKSHSFIFSSILLVLLSLMMFNFIYFFNQYFVQQNYFNTVDWQYGYEKAIPEIKKIEGKYKKVIISDRNPLDKSYMFFLFYLKFSPAEYQKIGALSSGGFASTHNFDKYEFRPINWDKDKNEKNVLFVGSYNDFLKTIHTVTRIYYPDGNPAILIVDPKDNI